MNDFVLFLRPGIGRQAYLAKIDPREGDNPDTQRQMEGQLTEVAENTGKDNSPVVTFDLDDQCFGFDLSDVVSRKQTLEYLQVAYTLPPNPEYWILVVALT